MTATKTTHRSSTIDPSPKIAMYEWRFVLLMIVIVLVLTAIPYLYAYLSEPEGQQFMGIMLDVPDHAQYFSWMRELSSAFLASNKMTAEPNQPVFFNLLWWGLGHLQRWFGLSLGLTFQLLRNISGALFLAAGYLVISRFLQELWQRRTAFLILCFGSGFGWMLVLLKYTVTNGVLLFPLDVFIAEGNTFLGILAYPHFIAAALYTLVFVLFLEGIEREQIRYAIIGGLLAQFLGWQHAYDLVLVYGVLLGFVAVKAIQTRALPRFPIKSSVVIGVLSIWPALYSFLLTSLDPLWRDVLGQFENAGVFTPNLLHLPILMGPAFLLAIAGFLAKKPLQLSSKSNTEILLLTWFAANSLLIYIPTDFRVHLLNGWQIPISILATVFVFQHLIPYLEQSGRLARITRPLQQPVATGILVLLLVAPTNIYLWAWRFVDLSRHDYPFYLHTEEVDALHWLEEHATGDDVVLSSLSIGQFIPGWTGARAYVAHWAQTIDFFTKQENVDAFFNEDTSSAERNFILGASNVDFIFHGPAEMELGDFSPQDDDSFVKVFSEGDVAIFHVAK